MRARFGKQSAMQQHGAPEVTKPHTRRATAIFLVALFILLILGGSRSSGNEPNATTSAEAADNQPTTSMPSRQEEQPSPSILQGLKGVDGSQQATQAPPTPPTPTQPKLKPFLLHIVAVGDSLTQGARWSQNFRKLERSPWSPMTMNALRSTEVETLARSGLRAAAVSGEYHGFAGKTAAGVLYNMDLRWGLNATTNGSHEFQGGGVSTKKRPGPFSNIPHVAICAIMVGTNDLLRPNFNQKDVLNKAKELHRKCRDSYQDFKMGPSTASSAKVHRNNKGNQTTRGTKPFNQTVVLRSKPLHVVSMVMLVPPLRYDQQMLQKLNVRADSAGAEKVKRKLMAYCFSSKADQLRQLTQRTSLNEAFASELHHELRVEAESSRHDHEQGTQVQWGKNYAKNPKAEPPVYWHVSPTIVDFSQALEWDSADPLKGWADCLHPNAAGNAAMADVMAKSIASSVGELGLAK